MRSKKGFTLLELLAVVVILAIMMLGAVPNLVQTFNRTKDKQYEQFIKRIEEAARVYAENKKDEINSLKDVGGITYITIQDIIDEKLLREPLIDPKTNKAIDLNSYVKITRLSNNNFTVELFVGP
ncbi:MAG: type II secretion system protein [Bacilli bacterium]|nr:type II secretion system protein [Bacilli bacterium]